MAAVHALLYGLLLVGTGNLAEAVRPAAMSQVLWALAGMSKSSLPERKQAAVEIIDKCVFGCCAILSYAFTRLCPHVECSCLPVTPRLCLWLESARTPTGTYCCSPAWCHLRKRP